MILIQYPFFTYLKLPTSQIREGVLLQVSGVFHNMENILQRRYQHIEVYDVKWHVM